MDNNSNAIALVTCTGLAFFLALDTPKLWLKGIAFAAAALMIHAILFSFSRGGMLALVCTGFVAFLLLPKRPKDYLLFAVAVAVVIRLAGPAVTARFETTFADASQRDESAASRLRLWAACWDLMLKNPWGLGADQFTLVVRDYGFDRSLYAHTLWLQIGAEVGFPGLTLLALFYLLCILRILPLVRGRGVVMDPWLRVAARMVVASLVGFMVSAQFVSLTRLEVPFYIVLIGAGVLKLNSLQAEGERMQAEG
jgi:O-antigen ligase